MPEKQYALVESSDGAITWDDAAAVHTAVHTCGNQLEAADDGKFFCASCLMVGFAVPA